MPADWLEALSAEDLGVVINQEHYAATQSADEEYRQEVQFLGAFGQDGPVIKSVRRADSGSVGFSALLLKPGLDAGLDDEVRLLGYKSFAVAIRRGTKWYTHNGCEWVTVRVNSTLQNVTLNADMMVPGYRTRFGVIENP